MKVFWPTIPTDFPLGYALASSNEHRLYVKRRWPGRPDCTYPPGFLDQQWELGCLLPGCEQQRTSVVTIDDLIASLKEGYIVGTYANGILTTFGQTDNYE